MFSFLLLQSIPHGAIESSGIGSDHVTLPCLKTLTLFLQEKSDIFQNYIPQVTVTGQALGSHLMLPPPYPSPSLFLPLVTSVLELQGYFLLHVSALTRVFCPFLFMYRVLCCQILSSLGFFSFHSTLQSTSLSSSPSLRCLQYQSSIFVTLHVTCTWTYISTTKLEQLEGTDPVLAPLGSPEPNMKVQ